MALFNLLYDVQFIQLNIFLKQIWIHHATLLMGAATYMLNVKQPLRALITHVNVRAITQLLEEFAKQVNQFWNKYFLGSKLDHMSTMQTHGLDPDLYHIIEQINNLRLWNVISTNVRFDVPSFSNSNRNVHCLCHHWHPT